METWQIDSTLYLLDTLYISRPLIRGNNVVPRIVDDNGKAMNLPISKDGMSYVITREIYGNKTLTPKRFSIKEFDRDKKWEYVVYRRLIIEPVSMSNR